MISPERAKRSPANTIFDPVISGVMLSAPKPILMSGYAQPHKTAQVSASIATQRGCWKTEMPSRFIYSV